MKQQAEQTDRTDCNLILVIKSSIKSFFFLSETKCLHTGGRHDWELSLIRCWAEHVRVLRTAEVRAAAAPDRRANMEELRDVL